MILKTEEELIKAGEELGKTLKPPYFIELVGDVGAGKTTFVKGLARGWGIDDEITSPSYTISKCYQNNNITLNHYDFYRLDDPGIMSEDLEESLNDPDTITVVEWADIVRNTTPDMIVKITIKEDGSRELEIKNNSKTAASPAKELE